MVGLVSLDHAWIAAHIPHQGEMCLLHRVQDWDAQSVRCSAVSHRALNNPLRAHGRLGAACGIEYAAQAMAVHGALLASQVAPAKAGFLASVRAARLHVGRLDDIAAELTVEARQFSSDGNNVLYDFWVRAAGRILLEGRAAVVLNARQSIAAAAHQP
ncbi:MAG: 3-hydroxylacyl-ACP dehydratase [Glaciimonas sp.]|nr:3-hydroxylacyl-ACP dehydratase [Glaciimonas sp.]